MSHFNFVTTYSGKRLNFRDPDPDDILIEDIAHNLAMMCRFNGSVVRHYSVAEHSLILSDYIYRKTGDVRQTLSALMHDSAEAYIQDIPRPIKRSITGYKEIEDTLLEAILDKFGIDWQSEDVWYADQHIVRNEAINLFKYVPEWIEIYDMLDIEDCEFVGLSNVEAEKLFLSEFERLTKLCKGE